MLIKSKKEIEEFRISNHPVAVANILSDLKLDSATITTGLLHDTIEDTYATYQTIKEEFGQEVADLVEGVTKYQYLKIKRLLIKIKNLLKQKILES